MRYAALAILLALGTTSIGWAAETQPAGFEPVDRIHHFGRLYDWSYVDRDSVIVWITPSRPYLIDLKRGTPDLRFAEVIGMTSSVGTTYANFDSIRVRGFDYPIAAIYKLSRDEARVLGQA